MSVATELKFIKKINRENFEKHFARCICIWRGAFGEEHLARNIWRGALGEEHLARSIWREKFAEKKVPSTLGHFLNEVLRPQFLSDILET